jgi:hypothetical protein
MAENNRRMAQTTWNYVSAKSLSVTLPKNCYSAYQVSEDNDEVGGTMKRLPAGIALNFRLYGSQHSDISGVRGKLSRNLEGIRNEDRSSRNTRRGSF